VPDEFEAHRRRCFAIAYRMLGSAAEAEDILQEAWIRWQGATQVESPGAYLATTVTRLCLDQLKSARVRREQYVGPWLPEPIDTAGQEEIDPESISMAFLLLLERLSPPERAALLLRQVFELEYTEIAAILGGTEAAARQSFHRAHEHLRAERPRYAPSKEQHLRLLTGFVMAVERGEVGPIEALLAEDARSWNDGGGRRRAALKTVMGRRNVAALFAGLVKKGNVPGRRPEIREINGWPALLLWDGDELVLTLSIETDGELIFGVHVVLNPDKLQSLKQRPE
jgi:RNA polymerase sigma-70 factor (ECF subfamily)